MRKDETKRTEHEDQAIGDESSALPVGVVTERPHVEIERMGEAADQRRRRGTLEKLDDGTNDLFHAIGSGIEFSLALVSLENSDLETQRNGCRHVSAAVGFSDRTSRSYRFVEQSRLSR